MHSHGFELYAFTDISRYNAKYNLLDTAAAVATTIFMLFVR